MTLPVAGGGASMQSESTCCSLAYYARHIVNIAPEGEATSREQSGTPQRIPSFRLARSYMLTLISILGQQCCSRFGLCTWHCTEQPVGARNWIMVNPKLVS
jgi:hypothetical protein